MPASEQHLYIAFNAEFKVADIQLPAPPKGKNWYRIIDTSLESPQDFEENPKSKAPIPLSCKMPAYSSFVAKAL